MIATVAMSLSSLRAMSNVLRLSRSWASETIQRIEALRLDNLKSKSRFLPLHTGHMESLSRNAAVLEIVIAHRALALTQGISVYVV
jgi:hypothetical protein